MAYCNCGRGTPAGSDAGVAGVMGVAGAGAGVCGNRFRLGVGTMGDTDMLLG